MTTVIVIDSPPIRVSRFWNSLVVECLDQDGAIALERALSQPRVEPSFQPNNEYGGNFITEVE